MSAEIRQRVDDLIEKELSFHLSSIGQSEQTLMLIGEFVEGHFKHNKFFSGQAYRHSIEILIERILQKGEFQENSDPNLPEKVFKACDFSSDYFHLRNLIFYSFNSSESVSWKSQGNTITVEVTDPTIFRQYIVEHQNFAINSHVKPRPEIMAISEVINTLKGTSHWEVSNPKVKSILDSIEYEVDWKIKYMFSGIPLDSSVDIGGFSFQEFLKVYKCLIFLALYERAFSTANDLFCVITYGESELSEKIALETSVNQDTCEKITRAISNSSGFSFVFLQHKKKFILFPFAFSLRDGISDILKHFAKTDEKGFSSRCAPILGRSLVDQVTDCFAKFKNFRIIKEISLQKFDSQLPDIDILAISYEPSLGFHFYVCEVKNTLHADWAKEYLKSIGKKGFITKAISQVEKVNEFLLTEEGQNLLFETVKNSFGHLDFKKLFPNGFCGLVEFLVISSQSIGMFYPNLNLTIINSQMLQKIIEASDGDVNYIQFHLRHLNQQIDDSYSKTQSKLTVGETIISIDTVSIKHFFKFIEHKYLSAGELESLEKTALETGYSYINSIS